MSTPFLTRSSSYSQPSSSKSSYSQLNQSVFPITLTIMVSLISTLITLLFFQTTQTFPIGNFYLNRLSKELSTLSNSKSELHIPTLNDLEDNFYSVNGITHDVFIKKIHSHNDYWRKRPLFDAISLGVQSVEADVWYLPELKGEEIYVGHSLKSLKMNHLLNDLYLDPLYAILKGSNYKNDSIISNHQNGIFDTESTATLYFFIDFKTDGDELFDVLYPKFDKFRERNWLSWYNTSSGEFHNGPLTIIGTGNTPLDKVLNQGEKRDFFFDAPLDKLGDPSVSNIDKNVSPIASSSLRRLVGARTISTAGLTSEQFKKVEEQVNIAHNLGIETRIWDTPWWPVSTKFTIWKQILESGSDFLNADDLETAVKFSG